MAGGEAGAEAAMTTAEEGATIAVAAGGEVKEDEDGTATAEGEVAVAIVAAAAVEGFAEDEESLPAPLDPGTGPAPRATPTCLRPKLNAFDAAHPGQVTEEGEEEVGQQKVEVDDTSLRVSKRRDLPERCLL